MLAWMNALPGLQTTFCIQKNNVTQEVHNSNVQAVVFNAKMEAEQKRAVQLVYAPPCSAKPK